MLTSKDRGTTRKKPLITLRSNIVSIVISFTLITGGFILITPTLTAAAFAQEGNTITEGSAAATCLSGNATHPGTPGNDVIVGTERSDIIAALGGDDTIEGLGGDDFICGDEGNDYMSGDAGDDYMDGSDGDDNLGGGDGDDDMYGDAGNDFMSGDAGNDHMYGDAGDDNLDGGDPTAVTSGMPSSGSGDLGNGGAGIDQCINLEESPIGTTDCEGASLGQQQPLLGNATTTTTLGNATTTLGNVSGTP